MSKSIHVTIIDFRGWTRSQIDEQSIDPNSDLKQWGKKSAIKKETISKRRIKKQND